ncbi:MAG: hypothetical protein ABSF83_13505 [Nitrososphaerales archaeon]|jgi:hypothetical protein
MATMELPEGARESEGSSAPPIGVKMHGTSMAVWNVPTPVEFGTVFNPKIGVRCDDGCVLSGATVEVVDGAGKTLVTGTLGAAPWSGTEDLYWAEVQMKAPGEGGYHEWSARFPEAEVADLPHAGAAQRFALSATRPAQCTVTVSVTDTPTNEPVENAYVRLGLYTVYTDGSGVAKVSLPKDSYDFVVWKSKRRMQRKTVEVTKDEELKVELVGCKACAGLA